MTKNVSPKILVTICNYNHEKYLKQSIESIQNQSYQNSPAVISQPAGVVPRIPEDQQIGQSIDQDIDVLKPMIFQYGREDRANSLSGI